VNADTVVGGNTQLVAPRCRQQQQSANFSTDLILGAAGEDVAFACAILQSREGWSDNAFTKIHPAPEIVDAFVRRTEVGDGQPILQRGGVGLRLSRLRRGVEVAHLLPPSAGAKKTEGQDE
jgi:hypothetical protein